MAETTNNLRSTTISLDEYNKLVNEASTLRETKGALQTTIQNLQDQIQKLNEKQPVVKVIHYTTEQETHYDDWRDEVMDEEYRRQSRIEFINVDTATELAVTQAKAQVSNEIRDLKDDIRRLKGQLESSGDDYSKVYKQWMKAEQVNNENLAEKKEEYEKNLLKLKKASDEDAKNYKETIKELKEEIQKVKDNKTDIEIEEKRNKEIKDLKGRIKDLENTLVDLGKLNLVKRIFKLRTISAERLVAQKELLERENAANKVGTTRVKESGKYRKYTFFEEVYNALSAKSKDAYYWITSTAYSAWI
jgi:hypothetical protein